MDMRLRTMTYIDIRKGLYVILTSSCSRFYTGKAIVEDDICK